MIIIFSFKLEVKVVQIQDSTCEYNWKSGSEQRGIAKVYVIYSGEVLCKKISRQFANLEYLK